MWNNTQENSAIWCGQDVIPHSKPNNLIQIFCSLFKTILVKRNSIFLTVQLITILIVFSKLCWWSKSYFWFGFFISQWSNMIKRWNWDCTTLDWSDFTWVCVFFVSAFQGDSLLHKPPTCDDWPLALTTILAPLCKWQQLEWRPWSYPQSAPSRIPWPSGSLPCPITAQSPSFWATVQ